MAPFHAKQKVTQASTVSAPIFEQALRWLLEQSILTPKEVAGFPKEAKLRARTMSEVQGAPAIDRLNEAVRESLKAGEGAELWRERMKGLADLENNLTEVIQRTATHRAYLEGQDEVIRSNALEDVFEFYQYFATDDGRGRKTHVALDEKVFHRDSPMAKLSSKLLAEWNCRCSRVAITREDAEAIGIEPGQEGPPPKDKPSEETKETKPLAGFVLY